jgi:hypothetical protein
MKVILKYLIVFIAGLLLGAIPIYKIGESLNLYNQMHTATILAKHNAKFRSNELDTLDTSLDKEMKAAIYMLKRVIDETPGLECSENDLMNQELLIMYVEEATGETLEPLCPNGTYR